MLILDRCAILTVSGPVQSKHTEEIIMIYLIKGAVETLEYFSLRIADALRAAGEDVILWDMKKPLDSRLRFERLNLGPSDVLITFNFIGLSGESQFSSDESSIWNIAGMHKICILVDHPLYYYARLTEYSSDLTLYLIDREHVDFVKRYYPKYTDIHFLPLAGNMPYDKAIPLKNRSYDLVFTGSYIGRPTLSRYEKALLPEVVTLYNDMIDALRNTPSLTLTSVMEDALDEVIPEASPLQKLACMYQMMYVDLSIRGLFRHEIVKKACESGKKTIIIGGGWEESDIADMPNVTFLGLSDSATCLRYTMDSRLSLNMLPWFKDGAHDRMFTSMLAKTGLISDMSSYTTKVFPTGLVYEYTLENTDAITDLVTDALSDLDELEHRTHEAYEYAMNNHRWEHRAMKILERIKQWEKD